MTDVIHFLGGGYFLPFYPHPPPNNTKNQILKKNQKNPVDIIILHMCTKKNDHMMYGSWNMVGNRQMDKQMDRQKKWHIEVGAPPKYCWVVAIC